MLHQRLDHFRRAGGHAVGQFLHRDVVGQDDFSHYLHLIAAQQFQFRLPALALALAPHRGQAADAIVLAFDRRLHVDLAGAAAVVDALLRGGDLRLARGHARQRTGAPDRAGIIVFFGGARRLQAQRLAGRPSRGGGGGGLGRARRRARHATLLAATGSRVRRLRRRLRRHLRLGRATRFLLGAQPRFFLDLAARLVLGGLAGFLLAAPGFLGGREDGDLLLLPPFGLALGVFALLFGERALAGGKLGRSQRPPGADRRTAGRGGCRARGGRGRARRRARRRGVRAPRGRRGRARLAHFHLHDLGPAVAETLSNGSGIHGPAQLQATCRSQREPSLGRVLIVAFAHLPACIFSSFRPAGPGGRPSVLRRREAAPPAPFASPPGCTKSDCARPARRSASVAMRSASRPAATATWTTWSRPNTAPSVVASSGATTGPAQWPRKRARSSGLPSAACTNQCRRPLVQPLPRLGESGNRLPGASGKPKVLADPPHQRSLQTGEEIGGHRHRGTGRLGERAPGASGFYHIPPGTQPNSPPGQPCSQVGNHRAVRPDDEADHPLLRQPLARHRAAPQRPPLRLVRFVSRFRRQRGISRGRPPACRRPRTARRSRPTQRSRPAPAVRRRTSVRAPP